MHCKLKIDGRTIEKNILRLTTLVQIFPVQGIQFRAQQRIEGQGE